MPHDLTIHSKLILLANCLEFLGRLLARLNWRSQIGTASAELLERKEAVWHEYAN